MSWTEFQDWRAFFAWRNDAQARAAAGLPPEEPGPASPEEVHTTMAALMARLGARKG